MLYAVLHLYVAQLRTRTFVHFRFWRRLVDIRLGLLSPSLIPHLYHSDGKACISIVRLFWQSEKKMECDQQRMLKKYENRMIRGDIKLLLNSVVLLSSLRELHAHTRTPTHVRIHTQTENPLLRLFQFGPSIFCTFHASLERWLHFSVPY